jgi:hypothetical protein
MANKFIYGIYDDESKLIDAVEHVRAQGLDIHDCITPFPVHGLDAAMGLKETRLHITGFLYGMTGFAIAFSFIGWVFTSNWPINYGGKPYFSFPAWIPIMFEFTVLSASVMMTLTFLARCGLYPGRKRDVLDPRLTDDRFALVFNPDASTKPETANKMAQALRDTGAIEVKEKELIRHY